MSDIVERLNTIREHLRTGRFGQREVWEEWLTEALAEIERLREKYPYSELDMDMHVEAVTQELRAEIERLREENSCLVSERIENEAKIERLKQQIIHGHERRIELLLADNERLRAALELIAGGTTDKLQAMQARCALDNIGPSVEAPEMCWHTEHKP